ncbi:MAG: carbohydrate binding domain-containing protein [Bacteroidales bacterium]|nr:carbohydrate binding domain-containing protein [Bacteroidales bacterium]
MRKGLTLGLTVLLSAATLLAQPRGTTLVVDDKAEGIPIQPTMYGIFLEDINFAADGGLYAEKICNRSFEYDNPLQGWKTFGKVEVLSEGGPFDRNPHYVRLRYPGHPARQCGLENGGWLGIGLEAGAEYRLSFWARTAGKPRTVGLLAALCDPYGSAENQVLGAEEVTVTSSKWTKYEVVLKADRTAPKGAFRLLLWDESQEAVVDLEHVSLFPADTFHEDENGLRKDLAQALADLHPGILRFPGGCIVEGTSLDNRYQWKNTVGPVENRPININRWNYGTFERMFPDYYQSGGLGFYEYFRLAEEIGAEPVPIVSCGMACQFQNDPEWHPNCSLEDLGTYIQDALDLIEFANGSPKSKWGKVRAEMGHPEPFGLKYLGIGNEQWGAEFIERFEPFMKAVRAKYPDIQIVGTSGPYLGGEWFDDLWKEMRRLGVDLVDEHYYSWEGFYEKNANRYDSYPRTGPKVFAGEYACHGSDGKKFNHFNAALLEASFMTGLERNADVVVMSSYAPTFAHVDGWQWRPDLIWFDNLRVMRSCSYYVQQLYAANKGSRVIPLTIDGKPVADVRNLNATCAVDDATGDLIVKIANLSPYSQVVIFDLPGGLTGAERTALHSDNPMDENTLDEPSRVVPVTEQLDLAPVADPDNEWLLGVRHQENGRIAYSERLGGRTFAVYRFHTK